MIFFKWILQFNYFPISMHSVSNSNPPISFATLRFSFFVFVWVFMIQPEYLTSKHSPLIWIPATKPRISIDYFFLHKFLLLWFTLLKINKQKNSLILLFSAMVIRSSFTKMHHSWSTSASGFCIKMKIVKCSWNRWNSGICISARNAFSQRSFEFPVASIKEK